MKANETYNGWTNYATWRVMLEIFDGYMPEDDEDSWDAERVQNYADELISIDVREPSVALDYARAFLSDVNWYEIADALNERIENSKL